MFNSFSQFSSTLLIASQHMPSYCFSVNVNRFAFFFFVLKPIELKLKLLLLPIDPLLAAAYELVSAALSPIMLPLQDVIPVFFFLTLSRSRLSSTSLCFQRFIFSPSFNSILFPTKDLDTYSLPARSMTGMRGCSPYFSWRNSSVYDFIFWLYLS